MADAHPFSVCKNANDLLGVEGVDFFPDPPQSGKDLKVVVRGRSQVDITPGAKLVIEVRVFGVIVSTQVMDVCEDALVACPLEAGSTFEVAVTQPIPVGTPTRVNAIVRVQLKDAQGVVQTCLESTATVVGGGELQGDLGAEQRQISFLYEKWKQMYPRAQHNLEIFAANWARIVKHNADRSATYTMAMNEFGSMTADEFARSRMGVREDLAQTPRTSNPLAKFMLRSDPGMADPPAQIDWTELGKVTRVKNQGSCGSCWAFSAIGALESAYAIKTGNLVELSEQEVVSCDTVDSACQGGLMDNAFNFIIKRKKDLCTSESYPYMSGTTGTRGTCAPQECEQVPDTVPTSFVDIAPNEKSLLAAVASHGPVSVAIQADQTAFQFYHSGVMTGQCGAHLNHGVLLVGYGTDETSGHKFWKLKNSWGERWGEAGYIRIVRGKFWPLTGQCGIAAVSSYPVF